MDSVLGTLAPPVPNERHGSPSMAHDSCATLMGEKYFHGAQARIVMQGS